MYNLFHKDDTQVKYTMLVLHIFTSLIFITLVYVLYRQVKFPLQELIFPNTILYRFIIIEKYANSVIAVAPFSERCQSIKNFSVLVYCVYMHHTSR